MNGDSPIYLGGSIIYGGDVPGLEEVDGRSAARDLPVRNVSARISPDLKRIGSGGGEIVECGHSIGETERRRVDDLTTRIIQTNPLVPQVSPQKRWDREPSTYEIVRGERWQTECKSRPRKHVSSNRLHRVCQGRS